MTIIWLAISLPGVEIAPLLLASAAVVIGVGFAVNRPAKTTWSALQLILLGAHRRLDPDDRDRIGLGPA